MSGPNPQDLWPLVAEGLTTVRRRLRAAARWLGPAVLLTGASLLAGPSPDVSASAGAVFPYALFAFVAVITAAYRILTPRLGAPTAAAATFLISSLLFTAVYYATTDCTAALTRTPVCGGRALLDVAVIGFFLPLAAAGIYALARMMLRAAGAFCRWWWRLSVGRPSGRPSGRPGGRLDDQATTEAATADAVTADPGSDAPAAEDAAAEDPAVDDPAAEDPARGRRPVPRDRARPVTPRPEAPARPGPHRRSGNPAVRATTTRKK